MLSPEMMGGASPGPTVAPMASDNEAGKMAIQALEAWAQEEDDPEYAAGINDLIAKASKILLTYQKMNDTALGVGPGEKFVRRQRGGGGGSYA